MGGILEDIKSGIYCIKNILNNKRYIGSAINLKKRKYEHFHTLEKGMHDNDHLQKSYDKYGKSIFIFEIIEYIENKFILIDRENYYINFYNSNNPEYGFNIRKLANSNLGLFYIGLNSGSSNPFFGKTHSVETRNKMSKSQTGIKRKDFSKEARERMSQGQKRNHNNIGSKNPSAKLTENDIIEIRMRLKNNESVEIIKNIFSVSKSAIYRIKTGVAWKHVQN
jgi:group I intron endonuclease